jgi:hypothetical protein
MQEDRKGRRRQAEDVTLCVTLPRQGGEEDGQSSNDTHNRRHARKRVIQYSRAAAIRPWSRGVLDTPLEPVIGLAEGETR